MLIFFVTSGQQLRGSLLIKGGPAIDGGTSVTIAATLTTDQRGSGFPRTIDNSSVTNATGADGTDIGSFELGPP